MQPFDVVGSSYKGFRVTKVVPIPELQCTLRELTHEYSGAQVLHIENDDPENLFSLSFQTLPASSNGVAHILEHTVLCGSKKFPVKDPFFAMNRRSLNTFMNALTGSDFTCYPAATQISKDFYNLLDVYIDAVFYPNLNELSFKQEGHRLEFETPTDPATPLIYRGIVFNEMKGALNSGPARMHEILYQHLFPNSTYGVNSGGDPKNIPDLTYNELLEFHRKFYHPSRCLFFFYGNYPLNDHLDFIEERVLKYVEKVPPLPLIPPEPRFTAPKKVEKTYPISPGETLTDKTLISFAYLTCHVLEQETCLALSILEIILMDTDASPLKKAFLQSTLCKQVTSYVDTEINEIPFIINFKGANPENADELEKIMRATLENIVKEGIPPQAIENAIHQLEFHRSEITGDYNPFGLTLFMRSALLMQHGGRPENGLIIHKLFDEVRRKTTENPRYFTDLIQEYLLDNTHFVSVTLLPDHDLEQKEAEEEKTSLENLKEKLSADQVQLLIRSAEELKTFQHDQENENIDVLPKVELSDIPRAGKFYPLNQELAGNLEIFHHPCFTNEIGYVDVFFDLPPLTQRELMYTRLMTVVLYQMGCGGRGYEETLEYVQANTGGVYPFLNLHIQAQDYNQFLPTFAIRGKALYRKLRKLFPLLTDFITRPDFSDKRRLKEILFKHHANLESSLTQSSLKYAVNLSASSLNHPSYIADLWYGLDYYYMIHRIALDFDAHVDEMIATLDLLKDKLLKSPKPQMVLSFDQQEYQSLKKHQFYGIEGLPTASHEPWKCEFPLPLHPHQGRIISSPVAYLGKVFKTIPYVHPDAPALNLASFLFDNLTLHKKIREQGGAYGGGAVSNVLSGNFYFYSYRDPNISSSLTAFEEAIENVVTSQFDDHDLESAKLEMIQNLDGPISPGSRADVAFNWIKEGKTREIRQAFRERLISATCEDVSQAVKNHIVPNYQSGTTVVFAGKELLEKENVILEASGKTPLQILSIN